MHSVLNNIVSLAGCTPKEIGESEDWTRIVRRAKTGRISLCRVLDGKSLFGTLYWVYSLTLVELEAVRQKTCHLLLRRPRMRVFREQRRRNNLNSTEEERPGFAKKPNQTTEVEKAATAPGCSYQELLCLNEGS